MPKDTVNGYKIKEVPATFDRDTSSHWTVTRPDGTEVGKYPTYPEAEKAARSFLPA